MTFEWESLIEESASSLQLGSRLGVSFLRAQEEYIEIHLLTSGSSCACCECCTCLKSFTVYQSALGVLGISGVVWDAGLALVDTLLSNQSKIAESSVLDLGCGTGVCGLTALLLSAAQVVLSDVLPMGVMRDTIDGLPDDVDRKKKLEFVQFDWNKYDDIPAALTDRHFDIVLCSDVLYESSSHHPLDIILRSLDFDTMLLSYKLRHPEKDLLFFKSLSLWCDVDCLFPASELFAVHADSADEWRPLTQLINLEAKTSAGVFVFACKPHHRHRHDGRLRCNSSSASSC